MNTPIEEMTDRELLMELVEDKRKEQRYRAIKLWTLIALVLLIGITGYVYLRPAIRSAQEISASLKEVTAFLSANESVVKSVEELANQLDVSKINDIASAMKELEPIIQALGKLFGQ